MKFDSNFKNHQERRQLVVVIGMSPRPQEHVPFATHINCFEMLEDKKRIGMFMSTNQINNPNKRVPIGSKPKTIENLLGCWKETPSCILVFYWDRYSDKQGISSMKSTNANNQYLGNEFQMFFVQSFD
jgi:hypothetical protein